MKRFLVQLVLSLVLLLVATACSGSDQPMPESTSATVIMLTATPDSPTATAIPQTNTPVAATQTETHEPSATPVPLPTETPPPTASPTLLPPLLGGGGGIITFTSDRDGNSEIYIMNADGSDLQRLTDHPFSDASPVWSPDGSLIAFVSARDTNRNVYIMNRDGSNLHPLTTHSTDDLNPVWFPDGSKIGFVSLRDGNAEIYRVNIDGTGLKRLTQNTYDDWEFEWSPDGEQMAISSQRTGFANIYLINTDESEELRQITDTEAHDVYPRWSPDGSQIAFTSNRDGNWEIYLMNSNGSNQRQLTTSDSNEGPPAWSPDGNQLIFESDQGGKKSIYIMDIDGTNIHPVTGDEANDWEPAWNPAMSHPASSEPRSSIMVPQGISPAIDGSISPEEWEGAAIEYFADGSELLLFQNGGYLYLGIRAHTTDMIVGNVFINQGDKVSILHISAALGTAIYRQNGNIWQQTKNFEWCCRGTRDNPSTQAERDEFFQHEGWVSINSRVGTPNELEYQIEIGSEPIQLAVNYLATSSNPNDKKPALPVNLNDDVTLPTPGGLPIEMIFLPEEWIALNLSTNNE